MPQNSRSPKSKRYQNSYWGQGGVEPLPPMAISSDKGKTTYITKDEYKTQYLNPWLAKLNAGDATAYDSRLLDHAKYAKSVGYLSNVEYSKIANQYTKLVRDLRSKELVQNVDGKEYVVEIAGPDGKYRAATGADLILRNKPGESPYVRFAGYPANAEEFEALGKYNASLRESRMQEIKKAPKPSTGIAKATNDWISPATGKELFKDMSVPVLGTGKAVIEGISRAGNEIDRALDLPTDPYYDAPEQLGDSYGDRIKAFQEGVYGGAGSAYAGVQNIAEKTPGVSNIRQLYNNPEWSNALQQSTADTYRSDVANKYPGNADYGRGLIAGDIAATAPFAAATGIAGMNVAGSIGGRLLSGIGKESLGRGLGIFAHVGAPLLAEIAQQKIAPNQHNISDAVAWVTNPAEKLRAVTANEQMGGRTAETDPSGEYSKSVHTLASMAMFGGGAVGLLKDSQNIAREGIRAFNRLSSRGPITAATGALSLTGRSMLARQVGTEVAFGASGVLNTIAQQVVSDMQNQPDMAPKPQDWATSIIGGLFAARPSKAMGAAFHANPLARLDPYSMAYSRAYESVHGKMDRPASMIELQAARELKITPDKNDVKRVVQGLEEVNNQAAQKILSHEGDPTGLPKAFSSTTTLIKKLIEAHRTNNWEGLEHFESKFNELFPSIRAARFKAKDSINNPLDLIKLTGRYTTDRAESKAEIKRRTLELLPAFQRLILGDKMKGDAFKPEALPEGKQYYGVDYGDGSFLVIDKGFTVRRIIKAEYKDFNPDGQHKDIQVIDPYTGAFVGEPSQRISGAVGGAKKHAEGLQQLLGQELHGPDEEGVDTYVFQGVTPNGEIILSRNNPVGKSVVIVPRQDVLSTGDFSRKELDALDWLASLRRANPIDASVPVSASGKGDLDAADLDFTSELDVSNDESFYGRLIHSEDGVAIYQLKDGSLIFRETAPADRGVHPPMPDGNVVTDAKKHVPANWHLPLREQILAHGTEGSGYFLIPLFSDGRGQIPFVVRLSEEHVRALHDLFSNPEEAEGVQDGIDAVLNNALTAEGIWKTKDGANEPQIGDVVTFDDNPDQKFIVLTNPVNSGVLVKPIDNVDSPAYWANANDVTVKRQTDRDALMRIHQNRSQFVGIDPNADRPSNYKFDSEFFNAMINMGRRNGNVVVDDGIVNADSGTLSTELIRFARAENNDINVSASVLQSLRQWMAKNPDGADVAAMALDGALAKTLANTTVDGFMPLTRLLIAATDSKFQSDIAYLAERSAILSGLESDVVNIDSLYSASSPSMRDSRALLYAHARQLNNLLFSSARINDRIVTKQLAKIAKKLGITDQNEINEFSQKVRRTAGFLRSVHPLMHEMIMDGSIAPWFVDKVSGLPADMQLEALTLERDATGGFAKGKTGNDVIDNYGTEQGFEKAVAHISDLLESEINNGVDPNSSTTRRLLYDNGLGFLYEYAANKEAVNNRTSVRARLRSHSGLDEARAFKNDAIKSLVHTYRQRASAAYVDMHDTIARGEGVSLRNLVTAVSMADEANLPAIIIPDAEGQTGALATLQKAREELGLVNQTIDLKDAVSTEGLMGAAMVHSFDDIGGAVARTKQISKTDADAQEALTLATQLSPELLSKMMVYHGAMKAIIDSVRAIATVGTAEAMDDLILALYQSNTEHESMKYLFEDDRQYDRFMMAASDIARKKAALQNEDADVRAAREAGATGALGTFETSRNTALAALARLTPIEHIANKLIERMQADEASAPENEKGLTQMRAWTWSTLALAQLNRALAKNIGRISNNDATNTILRNTQQNAIRIKEQVRTSALATELQQSFEQFDAAIKAGAANGTNFLGHEFDPDAIPRSISEVSDKVATNDVGPIELWESIKQKASEIAKVLQHINTTGTAYDSDNPESAQAMRVQVEKIRDIVALNNDPAILARVYNRAGLERVLQLHLLAEARNQHGEIDVHSLTNAANDETSNVYARNVEANNMAVGLRSSYLNKTKSKTLLVALHPDNVGEVDVNLDPSIENKAMTGQLIFDQIYQAIASGTKKSKANLSKDVKDLLHSSPKNKEAAVVSYEDIIALAKKYGVNIEEVLPAHNSGKGFTGPIGADSKEAIPYRINSIIAGLIGNDILTTGDIPTGKYGASFKSANLRKLPALIATHVDIFSLNKLLDNPQIKTEMSRATADSLRQLYGWLINNNDTYTADEEQVLRQTHAKLSKLINVTDATTENTSSNDVVNVTKDINSAKRTAFGIGALVDRFAMGDAHRRLDYDIHSNANREKYFALALAAGMPHDVLQQMFAMNASVGQLLSPEAIGDYAGPLLTSQQTLELQSLRLAQLHQDWYRSQNPLYFSSFFMMKDTHEAPKGYRGFLQRFENRNDRILHLNILGLRQAGDVSVHEIGHYLFHSLPDHLQVRWMQALHGTLDSEEGKGAQIQPAVREGFDQMREAVKLYTAWDKARKLQDPANRQHDLDFKLPAGWDWGKYNNEMSTTGLTNFIMSGGIVQSRESSTVDNHAVGLLQELSVRLRDSYNSYNKSQRIENAVIISDGGPLDAFWYSLNPVKIGSSYGDAGNQRLFYPLKHNSYVQFTTPVNPSVAGGGAITNPLSTVMGFLNTGKEIYSGALDMIPDPAVRRELETILNNASDLDAIEKRELIFQFIPGAYKKQDPNSYDPLSRGYVASGKVVGLAFASNFQNALEVPSEFTPIGWRIDSNGNRRLWVMKSRQDDNGWYQSNMPFNSKGGQYGVANLNRSDYAYVVEAVGTAQLLEADGLTAFGKPKYKVANRNTGPTEGGKPSPSTYSNVSYRYLVPHDAIVDNRVHGLGSSNHANPVFSEVIYSAISRVSQALINKNGQIDYQHQLDLEDALAKKYGGDSSSIDQYYQAIDDVTAGLNGDMSQRLAAVNSQDSAAITSAKISGWPRTIENSRQLTQTLMRVFPDENVRAVVMEQLDDFIEQSRGALLDGEGKLRKEFTGTPHQLIIGGNPLEAKNENEFRGALVNQWLRNQDDVGASLTKMLTAWQTAAATGGLLDLSSTGLDFTVQVGTKKVNVESLFERIFDPSLTVQELQSTALGLQQVMTGEYAPLSQRVTLDHVNRSALNHVLTKIFTTPEEQARYLHALFAGDVDTAAGQAETITARNIFNGVRHIMAADSQMRRTALRNWRKWNIEEVDGNTVILNAPSRDIAIRGKYKQSGALMRVDLSTGAIDYVQKVKEYRRDGIRERYVSITTADKAFKALAVGVRRKMDMFSSFSTKRNTPRMSLKDLFPGQDGESIVSQLVTRDILDRVRLNKDSSAVFFLPSTSGPKSLTSNDGLVGFKLTWDKSATDWVVARTNDWWATNNDYETQNLQDLIGVQMQNASPQLRTDVANRVVYGEAYHIARLLLMRDQMQDAPKFKIPERINDKQLLQTSPRLQLNDVGNLGTGRTWYSAASPHEAEYFEDFHPDGQYTLLPPKNIQEDPEAFVDWATAATMIRGEQYAARKSESVVYVPDASLKDTIGLGQDGNTQIVYLPEEMYDYETGLPKDDYILGSDSVPPSNSSTPVATAKTTAAPTASPLAPSGPYIKPKTNATGAAKFARDFLSCIKNDAQFILGCDLSTFGIQMIGRTITDPLGGITSLLAGGVGMLMPNREDVPFFIGMAIDRALRSKGINWGNFGEWHYDWSMETARQFYNRFYKTNYDFSDLEKYGWNSVYSQWRREHTQNQNRSPHKFKKITDTPFDPSDETLSRGILREFVPYAKRFDQTRLLIRDLFALKSGMDVMRNVNNQVAKKPFDIVRDLHNEMRNCNLDFGLQTFGDLAGQAPIFKAINTVSNFTQNAPSFHRNFINANPWLRHASLFFRDTLVNTPYRKMTKNLRGGLFDGDVYDVSWERRFLEHETGYGRQKQEGRMFARLFGGLGILAMTTAMNYFNHKQDPNKRNIAFSDNDYLNVTKKQIGYQKIGKDVVFEMLPVAKPFRVLRPFISLMSPNEPTVQAKAESFAKSATKTWVESRYGNLMSIATELMRGHDFSGAPSFDTDYGAAILKASNVKHRYEYAPSSLLLPTQSGFVTNHFNLVSAKPYYRDAQMLAAAKGNMRRNVILHGWLGDVTVDEIPVLTQEDVKKLDELDNARRLGFTVFLEPEQIKTANEKVEENSGMRATLQRWSYLLRNELFDWAGAAETVRKKGYGPIWQGYGVEESAGQPYGLPGAGSYELAQPIEYPVLPLGKDKAAAYGNVRAENKPSFWTLMMKDFERQFGVEEKKKKSNE